MQVFSGNKLAAQPRLLITRQKGISLIPALITICIFTLLTTQVIIPNQIRNTNEAFINNMAKSAEKLEQASLAFYAKNSRWPKSIKSELVPDFLPFFNEVTDTGFSWQLIEVITMRSGALAYNKPASWTGPRSGALLVEIGDHKLTKAVINKIGAHAVLSDHNGPFDPRFPPSDYSNFDFVLIPLMEQGIPVIDSLNIVNKITVTDIHLRGSIKGRSFGSSFGNTLLDGGITFRNSGHNHSSKRYKQNILSLETSIENIYQLNPVSFDYKEAFKQYKTPNAANSEIGLIAEQVLPLIPEITLLDNDNKVMGIDYPKLSILLLSAMQALKAEVTALQKNNQQLQQQMDDLNIKSEGLNIEGLNSANINKARSDHGTDE
jgi:hypothetical protein